MRIVKSGKNQKKTENALDNRGVFWYLNMALERAQYAMKLEIAHESEVTSVEYVRWRETAGESGG